MQITYEYVVIDPVAGELSCDNRAHAIEMSDRHNWPVRVNVWSNGEIIRSGDLPRD